MSETPKRPVRPRDAASLIILRGEGPDTEVLMGQRARRHRFMPDMYVFPGGRLDRGDRKAPVLRDLPETPLARLTFQTGREDVARGLAVAAARETWEETGLVFGAVENGDFLPDLSGMDYVARAITPPPSPIRFHARFFVTEAERAVGGSDAPLGGSGELLDLAFRPLLECLSMPIADVTEFVLEEVLRRVRGTSIEAVPIFSYQNNAPIIRYQKLDGK
ncbi:MAG: NUDIX hydrolase [Minwuia sp.]|uniref:NUDIX hydrolase n=1 Tax=Minwuia sp. TaxID=2493630 RepID=UPI003A861EA2